jgi:hypothetical protein
METGQSFVELLQILGEEADLNAVAETNRKRGLTALKKLVQCYVGEDRVEDVFTHVVECYDEGWQRYTQDKESGFVNPNSQDYRKYSWRGNGPRPYFEGIISSFMKKKKFRSIDD